MATKKPKAETKVKKSAKKKDSITLEMPGTIGSAKIILPKEKKKTKSKKNPQDEFFDLIGYTEGSVKDTPNVDSGGWPKINQGTHLTVKTFEDGRTELVWDWDALVSEVRAACLKAESNIPADMKPNVKAKVLTRKKKEAAMITASKKSK